MGIIHKKLPEINFTKIDNKIITMDSHIISAGAKSVYLLLAMLPQGYRVTDKYIQKKLIISSGSVLKYKQELKKLDLLYIDRVSNTDYDIYIGHSDLKAKYVCDYIKRNRGDREYGKN